MTRPSLAVSLSLFLVAPFAAADQAAPLSALAKMPVKEITVFKDGHALVLHEGKMPTDAAGDVLMDYLPNPVFGTYWPYARNVKLTAVVASQRKVLVERTALTIRELLEANIGAEAVIQEIPTVKEEAGAKYTATILGLPTRSSEELEKTSPPNSGEMLPQKGNVILLKTAEGVKAINIDRIRDVTFKKEHKGACANEEFRNLLRMKLGWGDKKPEKVADVGMMYLQRGVRWIPSYKLTIDGKGSAAVKFQATLINELADLEDVTAHLVIGVPTFQFQEMSDPISLQQAVAQLSQHFRRDARTAYALSNAMMSQQAGQAAEEAPDRPAGAAGRMDLGPEVTGSQRSEDLFIFTVQHVTLKKGQRMVMPVSEFTLPYKDVFTLDVPFTPPPEVWRQFDTSRQAELARLFSTPKVMHKLRLTNKSEFPLTTAPALIIRDDRVLAQGLMTYTAKGAEVDLPVTAAVDISVKKTDKETARIPNAEKWQGETFARLEFAGTIKLTNHRTEAVSLEVTRHVMGNVGEADHDGVAEMLNVFEDASFMPSGSDDGGNYGRPYWWGWYSWPYWWAHFNSVGRVTWKLTLDGGKSVDLGYKWHYYWR